MDGVDLVAERDTPLHGAAVDQLVRAIDGEAPYARSQAELLPLQIAALDERFQKRRAQIKVLDQRARDVGVDRITRLADIVPLLFSHQTYKSYPESFLTRGQWDRMTKWLGTLMTKDCSGLDMAGVEDVDGWEQRLAAAGFPLRASSGTTGKASFLPWSQADIEWHRRFNLAALAFQGLPPEHRYICISMGNASGPHRPVDRSRVLAQGYAKPGQIYNLFERRASIVEINRLGALRKAMVDGTIAPADLITYETNVAQRTAETEAGVQRLIRVIKGAGDTPIMIHGGWSAMLQLVQAARAAGVADGSLPAGSVYEIGGGPKGAQLPDDYEQQVHGFFAGARYMSLYGMSEINQPTACCSCARRHIPSSLVPILLDETGEQVLDYAHGATGRLGLFDLSMEGRWGGVITSDLVRIETDPCDCGLHGLRLEFIGRYSDQAGGDDKLTCAGTMAAYIRGAIDP